MVKQTFSSFNHGLWVQNAHGKHYKVFLGRGVPKSQLVPGRIVEVEFRNHKGYITGVCHDGF